MAGDPSVGSVPVGGKACLLLQLDYYRPCPLSSVGWTFDAAVADRVRELRGLPEAADRPSATGPKVIAWLPADWPPQIPAPVNLDRGPVEAFCDWVIAAVHLIGRDQRSGQLNEPGFNDEAEALRIVASAIGARESVDRVLREESAAAATVREAAERLRDEVVKEAAKVPGSNDPSKRGRPRKSIGLRDAEVKLGSAAVCPSSLREQLAF